MKLLVCGGRNYADKDRLFTVLDWARKIAKDEEEDPITTIIHGGAPGADSLAGEWAKLRKIKLEVFKADWDKNGPSAGPIRNLQMIREGKPDVAIVFPGGRGTADMAKRLKAANIAMWESNK